MQQYLKEGKIHDLSKEIISSINENKIIELIEIFINLLIEREIFFYHQEEFLQIKEEKFNFEKRSNLFNKLRIHYLHVKRQKI